MSEHCEVYCWAKATGEKKDSYLPAEIMYGPLSGLECQVYIPGTPVSFFIHNELILDEMLIKIGDHDSNHPNDENHPLVASYINTKKFRLPDKVDPYAPGDFRYALDEEILLVGIWEEIFASLQPENEGVVPSFETLQKIFDGGNRHKYFFWQFDGNQRYREDPDGRLFWYENVICYGISKETGIKVYRDHKRDDMGPTNAFNEYLEEMVQHPGSSRIVIVPEYIPPNRPLPMMKRKATVLRMDPVVPDDSPFIKKIKRLRPVGADSK